MTDKKGNIDTNSGYKRTNFGLIPSDWKMKPIGAVGKVITGSTPSTKKDSYYGGDYLFATPADLNSVKYVSDTEKKLTEAGFNTGRLIPKGSVLFVSIGSTIGKTGIANHDLITNQQINSIKSNGSCTDEYLFYQLNYLSERIKLLAGKQAVPILNKSNFESIRIPIPGVQEQINIAELLSTWDEAISKTEKLIKAKKRYKKGLMQRLLSGKVRFPEFEGEEWGERQLGDLLVRKKRKVAKPDNEYLSIGIRSHGKGTFQKPDKDPDDNSMSSLYKVNEDDLIVNITFAWEGAIAIIKKEDEGGYVSHRFPTYEFDTEKLIPEYFQYVIIQPWFVYKLGLISPGGAGRNRVLNKKDFLKLRVEVPSISEQNKIAGVLTNLDDEINLLEKQLEYYKNQKKGLMQQLLTGKIRVHNMEAV